MSPCVNGWHRRVGGLRRRTGGWSRFASALVLGAIVASVPVLGAALEVPSAFERQVTRRSSGHILTNTGVWSPDGRWLVYDVRSDEAGEVFDGTRIEAVQVETGEVRELYRSGNGACCGVVTFHPSRWQVVFIHGPEHPTPDWSYGPYHRRGVWVDWARPGVAHPLDARDLTAPFTPGALRGGSHVHVFSPDGRYVSFTYEDHVLAQAAAASEDIDLNQRNVGVSVVGHAVEVDADHPRNHSGTAFTVLVTQTSNRPDGSRNQIRKAFEEGWIGTNGYVRGDGRRQRHALTFQGHIEMERGGTASEVFVVDLPDDLTRAGEEPLAGTPVKRPAVPRGVVQRRVTFTEGHRHPGVDGPRHWLRTSPDGEWIAFLKKDDNGVVQLWKVASRAGGPGATVEDARLRQVTSGSHGVTSSFTWSPDGHWIAHTMDGSVCVTEVASGRTHRLTARTEGRRAPRPEAVVFSPDGRRIAYVRRVAEAGEGGRVFNQIFVAELR